ncbi:MAG: HTTM domain-containing protein [Candidatus Obscuribacterales bacterium]|nr:HTTM domain-containing protein [Candidatus Obscuribacterales bacterium]
MKALLECWNEFFFRPHSSGAIALCRILSGLVLLFSLYLMYGDLTTWLGYDRDAVVSLESSLACLPKYPCLALLNLNAMNDDLLFFFYWLAVLSAAFMTIGYRTKLSIAICFILLQSIMRRNPFILSGSDELLSQMLFYLFLSNCGASLSLDAYLKEKARMPVNDKSAPWAQRLLQINLCLIYLQTFILKLQQADWQNGSALYKVFQARELLHFPVPDFISSSQIICRCFTWSALLFELLLPVLIWYRPWRKWLVVLAIIFHLCMEYCLNIPLFQYLMIACLLTFVDGVYIKRFFHRLRPLRKVHSKA